MIYVRHETAFHPLSWFSCFPSKKNWWNICKFFVTASNRPKATQLLRRRVKRDNCVIWELGTTTPSILRGPFCTLSLSYQQIFHLTEPCGRLKKIIRFCPVLKFVVVKATVILIEFHESRVLLKLVNPVNVRTSGPSNITRFFKKWPLWGGKKWPLNQGQIPWVWPSTRRM